jgi:hypothetical protein
LIDQNGFWVAPHSPYNPNSTFELMAIWWSETVSAKSRIRIIGSVARIHRGHFEWNSDWFVLDDFW